MSMLWFLGSLGATTVVAALTYVAALPNEPTESRRTRLRDDESTTMNEDLVPVGMAGLRVLLGAPVVGVLEVAMAAARVWATVRLLIKGLFVLSCVGLCLAAVLYSYRTRRRGRDGRGAQLPADIRRIGTTTWQPSMSERPVRLSPSRAPLQNSPPRDVSIISGKDEDLRPTTAGKSEAWRQYQNGVPQARSWRQQVHAPAAGPTAAYLCDCSRTRCRADATFGRRSPRTPEKRYAEFRLV